MADSPQISVLVQTFHGLGLPSTLCIPVESESTVSEVHSRVLARLPRSSSERYTLTTTNNRTLSPSSSSPLSSLLSTSHPDDHHAAPPTGSFLPLRLSLPLLGGKGGFGSQLRAAGGRMSSRKKKNRAGELNGSNRNLDGRRLRTVNEAKALAEYLAVKPEMDRREKEQRRKRWESIVEQAEAKEQEIRYGNKGRVDGQWIESKDEAAERTREAVRKAMSAGTYTDRRFRDGSDEEEESEEEESSGGDEEEEEDAGEGSSSSKRTTPPQDMTNAKPEVNGNGNANGVANGKGKGKEKATVTCFGFDDDAEFMSSDDEEGDTAEKDTA